MAISFLAQETDTAAIQFRPARRNRRGGCKAGKKRLGLMKEWCSNLKEWRSNRAGLPASA
jgi:hypothetical protein